MDPKIKEAIDALKAAFEAFKAANNERLAQIEKTGKSDPLTEQKVEALNAEVTKLQTELEKVSAQARAAETAANRPQVGGPAAIAGVVPVATQAARFFAQRRNLPVEEIVVTDADVQAYANYRRGLFAYLRRGDQGVPGDLRNAMQVGSDPNGGYWVTPDMGGRMVQLIYETSNMRQLASATNISTDSLKGTYDLDQAEAGWVGETQTRSVTATPTIGGWEIFARELQASPKATQQLLDDSAVDVESWLNGKVSQRMGRLEETAFFTGDGAVKPRGILTYAAGTPTASAFNVVYQMNSGSITGFSSSDKLIDQVFNLKAAYRANANWLMAKGTVAVVRKLKDGQNNYLWQPNFEQRQGGLLLGYPVREAEDMPAIASASLSIAFGDFRQAYQIVDRQGIRVLRDPFTAKPWVTFYTTRRTGGDVVNFEAYNLMKFSV